MVRVHRLDVRSSFENRDATGRAGELVRPVFADVSEVLKTRKAEAPFLTLCPGRLASRLARLRESFAGELIYRPRGPASILAGLEVIPAGIDGFSVSSIGQATEVHDLFEAAGQRVPLLLSNPVFSRDEARYAITELGIESVVIDEPAALGKLYSISSGWRGGIRDAQARLEVAVRFSVNNPAADLVAPNSGGAQPHEASEMLRQVAQLGFKPSLCFDMGPDPVSDEVFAAYTRMAGGISRRAAVLLHRLGISGGLAAQAFDFNAGAFEAHFEGLQVAALKGLPGKRPRLVCDIGAALDAPAVTLLGKVKHRREDGRVYLSAVPRLPSRTLVNAPTKLPVRVWRDGEVLREEGEALQLLGPKGELSFSGTSTTLPRTLREGDWVEFGLISPAMYPTVDDNLEAEVVKMGFNVS